MAAIGDFFASLINNICNIFVVFFWWVDGLFGFADMFTSALAILVDVFDFFPDAVVSLLMTVCAGLFVLRVFGRS